MPIQEIQSDSKWQIISSSIVLDPKFAVKELIDNAIDSGATNVYIDVDAKTCGCQYIGVRDDGLGVEQSDRSMMCLNHATSKISNLSDLFYLSTLGFRGEALFAIATLCNQKGSMEITTRQEADKVGEKWLVAKDGTIKNEKRLKVTCPRGTTVVIRNLLGGLKCRYIQTSSRVFKNIEEFKSLINHYSLNYRSVRFHFSLVSLEKNGSVVEKQLQQSLNTNISKARTLSTIAQLRKPVAENFLLKDELAVNDLIKLDVILPKMNAKSDIVNLKKCKKFLSVNGRIMSLQLELGHSINKMLNSIYRKLQLLDPNVWYVNINCNMKIIDVNIEPGKDDILIKDMDFVLEQVKQALTSYLSGELRGNDSEVVNVHKEGAGKRLPELNCDPLKNIEESDYSSNTKGNEQTQQHEFESSIAPQNISSQPIQSSFEEHFKNGIQRPQRGGSTILQDTSALNYRANNRMLTTGSMVSNEGGWTKHLISEDNDSQKSDHISADLPSSLTYNYEDSSDVNEDLELSKNISVSNPFMTAKLRKATRNVNTGNINVTHANEHIQSTVDSLKCHASNEESLDLPIEIKRTRLPQKNLLEKFTINGRTKIRKLTNQEEDQLVSLQFGQFNEDINPQSLHDTTLVDDRPSDYCDKRSGRNITMFSEYTNSYTIAADYTCKQYLKDGYKGELLWLMRQGHPSERLLEGLDAYSNKFKNNKLILSKTNQGWYVLGI